MTIELHPIRAPRFTVVSHGARAWAVADAMGVIVQGSVTRFRQVADRRRDELQREDDRKHQRGERSCMCCGAVFMSQGIHNRLCPHCRIRATALPEAARPQLPRGGRA